MLALRSAASTARWPVSAAELREVEGHPFLVLTAANEEALKHDNVLPLNKLPYSRLLHLTYLSFTASFDCCRLTAVLTSATSSSAALCLCTCLPARLHRGRIHWHTPPCRVRAVIPPPHGIPNISLLHLLHSSTDQSHRLRFYCLVSTPSISLSTWRTQGCNSLPHTCAPSPLTMSRLTT